MDLIYCAGGGRVLAEIAIKEGFLYGARSDDIRDAPRCTGLVDINWKNYDWIEHLTAVQKHQPKYAVAPDIEQPRKIRRTLELAEKLEGFCYKVIIVPKRKNIIKHIPQKYLIGISVPTSYSGYMPSTSELLGRELHLLGGSPGQQRELWLYFDSLSIPVMSVDVNCHNKVSNFGKYWNGEKWTFEGKHKIDKYEAFRRSCRGIINMWKTLGVTLQNRTFVL
jgi:hypothetical protein